MSPGTNKSAMLSNVSWGQFLTGTIIILAIYWAIIGLFFYSNEIKSFLNRRLTKSPVATEEDQSAGSGSNATLGLEAVVADLRGIMDRVGKEAGRQQLLGQLGQRLASYTGLREPAFRAAINNYIILHAKEINGEHFTQKELDEHWLGLPG